MLIKIIAQIKDNINPNCIFIERIKGMMTLEDDTKVDYRIEATFDDISLWSCNNESNRLWDEEKGFLVYGRNVTADWFWTVINAFRSNYVFEKPFKTADDVTKAERENLMNKYIGEYLPEGWWYDGALYWSKTGKCVA